VATPDAGPAEGCSAGERRFVRRASGGGLRRLGGLRVAGTRGRVTARREVLDGRG